MQIFDSYIEAGQELSAKDKREYYTALIEYIYYGVEPNVKGAVAAIFTAIRPSIDLSKTRAEQGRKGAAKTNSAAKQNEDLPSGKTDSKTEDLPSGKTEISRPSKSKSNSKKKDIPKGISKKAPKFSPPSLEEVEAFASDHGLSVDAQRFIDYYESNGWRVGRNPMKNWQAALRNWTRNSLQQPAQPPATTQEVIDDELAKYFRD